MRRPFVLWISIGWSVASAAAWQAGPPAPAATAAISGVVVDGTTGQPIAGAVVTLSAPNNRRAALANRQVTDARGRFVFASLPAMQNIGVGATRLGYFGAAAGDLNPVLTPAPVAETMTLTAGQSVTNLRLALWRPGSISGVVRDERGEPCVGVEVRAVPVLRLAGRDRLAAGPTVLTDDRGAYRIAGLTPGRYMVAVPSVQMSVWASTSQAQLNNLDDAQYERAQRAATAPVPTLVTDGPDRVALGHYPVPPPRAGDASFAYPLTFAPGTASTDGATVIPLGYGESRSATDIQLAPLRTGEVMGRVEGVGPVANLLVRLLTAPDLGFGFETAVARTNVDGTFHVVNVPGGTYVLDVPARVTELSVARTGAPAVGRPPGIGSFNGNIDTLRGGPAGAQISSFWSGSVSFIGGNLNVVTNNPAALSARLALTVSAGAVTNVRVPLVPAGRISGTVEFEAWPTTAAPTTARGGATTFVTSDPADASMALGQSRSPLRAPNSAFVLDDVVAGDHFLRVGPEGWIVKSIVHDGQDYATKPLRVGPAQQITGVVMRLTRSVATITGVASASDGTPAVGVQVAAFPADRARWIDFGFSPPDMQATTTRQGGAYTIGPLPAGEYLVAAVPAAWSDRWRDREFFSTVASAAALVTLTWGETHSQAIKVTGR